MAFIDYYQTLGLAKNAGAEDIRKAYRKLARQYHPDVNPDNADAKQKFQQINEANEVLSDPEKRKKYDTYGEHWMHADQIEAQQKQQRSTGGNPFGGDSWQGYTYSGSGGGDEDFSDFFESLFGNRGGRKQAGFRGADVEAQMNLTLREASKTHTQEFSTGGRQVRITVHAGVADGQKIKLKGYGQPGGQGGVAGDLFITFRIADDPKFRRVGDDLYAEVPLDLFTAVLGGEAVVNTLDGQVKMKVKAGTQPGEKVRLRGKGFPVYRKEGQFGDLYVSWKIELPTQLTEEQRSLFERLQKSMTS